MKSYIQKRRKYFVDSQVQGAILRQAAYYWLAGSLVFVIVVTLYRIVPPWLVSGDLSLARAWHHLAPLVVSSAVFLPLVMFHAVRFSHRFAGPMVRFRQVLRLLSKGETAPQIRLRSSDFWQDVATELNLVSARQDQASVGESKHEEVANQY